MHLEEIDLVIALRLLDGAATLDVVSDEIGVASGQVHESVERLKVAQLLLPGAVKVNRLTLEEFLLHGARCAFPPVVSSVTLGVPTAHAAEPLASIFSAIDPYVWPWPDGELMGESLEPLYPGAPALRVRSPETYRLLTLFDALRVGRARERQVARELLREVLRAPRNEG